MQRSYFDTEPLAEDHPRLRKWTASWGHGGRVSMELQRVPDAFGFGLSEMCV